MPRETPYGYPVQSGYMGYTKYGWMLFATESDYEDYIIN